MHTPRRIEDHQLVSIYDSLAGYGNQNLTANFTKQNIKKCPDLTIDWEIGRFPSTATCARFFSNGFCDEALAPICPEHSTCTNGQFEAICTCNEGYKDDGDKCQIISK